MEIWTSILIQGFHRKEAVWRAPGTGGVGGSSSASLQGVLASSGAGGGGRRVTSGGRRPTGNGRSWLAALQGEEAVAEAGIDDRPECGGCNLLGENEEEKEKREKGIGLGRASEAVFPFVFLHYIKIYPSL
jgi:hypothetical protein